MQNNEFIRFAMERLSDVSFSLSDVLPSGGRSAAKAPPGFYDLLPQDAEPAAGLELPAPGGAWAPTERMGLL